MTHGRSWLILVLVLLTLAVIPSALATAQTRFVFANESPYDTKASGRLVSEPRFPDRVAGPSGPPVRRRTCPARRHRYRTGAEGNVFLLR